VRIFVQSLCNTIHRRLRSVQPVRIERAGTIEEGRHFEVADFQPVVARHLIAMLGRGVQAAFGPATMPASTAIRAATKRIESLLSMFLFLTTGDLISLPPLIVRVTIPAFQSKVIQQPSFGAVAATSNR